MTEQGALFETDQKTPLQPWQLHEPTPEFVHHSQNSQDAAFAIKPRAQSIRERVFELLKIEALTDQQIAARLQLDPNTARPRRIELANAGRIIEIGTARTASGRNASLWRAA